MKLITVISIMLSLSACTIFSGNVDETEGENLSKLTGKRSILRKKQTQAVAVSGDLAKAIASVSALESKRIDLKIAQLGNNPTPVCQTLTPFQFENLKSGEAQGIYLNANAQCVQAAQSQQSIAMLGSIIESLTQGKSDIAHLAYEYGQSIRSVASEGTKKFNAIANGIFTLGTSAVIGSVVKAGFDATRDVGISAAKNAGDINSNVSISNSQSNDPSSSLAGGGEASTATGNTTADGDASIGSPIINVGRGSVNSASDSAVIFDGTGSALAAAPSANATQVTGGNTDAIVNADDNNNQGGDQSNRPCNGVTPCNQAGQ